MSPRTPLPSAVEQSSGDVGVAGCHVAGECIQGAEGAAALAPSAGEARRRVCLAY